MILSFLKPDQYTRLPKPRNAIIRDTEVVGVLTAFVIVYPPIAEFHTLLFEPVADSTFVPPAVCTLQFMFLVSIVT